MLIKSALNFETQSSFTLNVTADDGELRGSGEVTINLDNVNEAPRFTQETFSFSVDENSPENALVGMLVVTDPDAEESLSL